MGMPTIVAVGTVGTATTGACVPGLPAGWVADHIHLLFVEAANEPLNTITGFTRIGSTAVVQSTGLVTDLSAFWRRAVAGDTAPSITSSPQNHLIARIIGVSGAVTAGSPISIFTTGLDNTTGTTFSIPGATTTAANCLIFAALSTGTDANSTTMATGWTNANLTSITEDIDNWTTSGNGGGIAVAHGGKVAPGAYGTMTGSITTGNTKAFLSFAVRGVGPEGDAFSYVAGMRGNGPLY
jgi:hypothetical protein